MQPSNFLRAAFALALLVVGNWLSSPSSASPVKVIYSFCTPFQSCTGGTNPGGLLRDTAGNLFGVSVVDYGERGWGAVYERIAGKVLTLYTFRHHGSQGKYPVYSLIMDVNGNLYGTTQAGGAQSAGTVFELSPPAPGESMWTFQVLHDFSGADGAMPSGSLTYAGADTGALYDGVSPLFGLAGHGGAANLRGGVAYSLTPGEQGWTESVLYNFCSVGGSACTDGFDPDGTLYLDTSGHLFGTASGDGQNSGVAFELSQTGGAWTETVLYDFCSQKACRDGAAPTGGLVQDASGNLYGMTTSGGRPCNSAGLKGLTCGVIFKLTPNGALWQESVLYRFCAKPDCKDGAEPYRTGLLLDASGNLFGTTFNGGGYDIDASHIGGGVVFRYANGAYSTLYRFCKQPKCADGEYPLAGVIPDGSGSLLGTTELGGANGEGEIFRLTP